MKPYQQLNHFNLSAFNQNLHIIEKAVNQDLAEKISLENEYDRRLDRVTSLQQQLEAEELLLKQCLKKLITLEGVS